MRCGAFQAELLEDPQRKLKMMLRLGQIVFPFSDCGHRSRSGAREVDTSDGRFVWISLHEPDQPLLRTVQQRFGLHDLAIEDALRAHQRPKLEIYGNSLFIVLRTASLHSNSHPALSIAAASHAVAGRARRNVAEANC